MQFFLSFLEIILPVFYFTTIWAYAKSFFSSVQLAETLKRLLSKIQTIAEKIQKNTSKMIPDEQFLTQEQVATTVLELCDDELSKILNGKVIPGDRVFYPVKPHITSSIINVSQPDFNSKTVVFVVDATDKEDSDRVVFLAQHIEKNGGKAVCLMSNKVSKEVQDSISSKFHSHTVDITNPEDIVRGVIAAKNIGKIEAFVYVTGKVPAFSKLINLSRKQWDALVDKFVNSPATVIQQALEHFVPGGAKDPRLYKGKSGRVIVIGPDLPVGDKITGSQRAAIEVFRGAMRPFTTTINQELSDVLRSNVRSFLILSGSVNGTEPDNERIAKTINYLLTDEAASSSSVIFCVDEQR